jgi:hypothetical protein
MKIKPKVKKYPNEGRPQFEWSKGIDNIQPITQTQNNSSITTGNKKLSTEELKKAAEYTKKYNQQHLEEEYNNRQNKLKQSIDAQKQPLSLKNLQTQTQSTGDKLSLAMNSKYGNPKDYPTLSGYMQGLDYINPAKMIGDMTSGLGSVPQDVNDGNYLKAGLSVASPLAVGAIAGVGANSVKPFVNNLVNPLAGTGEVINNLGNKYLPNTYKLNPSAFKPNSEAYYRIIGNEEGLDDLVNSGVLRSNPNNLNKKGSLMYKDPYFSKGVIFDKDYYKNNPYKGKYVAEVSDIEMHHNPPGSFSFDNNIAIPKDPIKINNPNLKLYQKDWLKGYKQIEIPKKGFNSEINWGKWNKEIPENSQLMKEYNAIESTSKANGSWMKNPDGSVFQGTPEQFVQQNSENFKKAFPTPILDDLGNVQINYHGSPNKFNEFDPNKFYSGEFGKGIYTSPYKEKILKSYANPNRKGRVDKIREITGGTGNDTYLYELYFNGKNPKSFDDLYDVPYDIKNYGKNIEDFPTRAELYKKHDKFLKENPWIKTDEDFDRFLLNMKVVPREKINLTLPDNDFLKILDTPLKEQVAPFSNIPKSALGNNGMFDMTNPNIYKSILPIGLGLGAASQIDKKQNGGSLKKYPNGGDLKNAYSITADALSLFPPTSGLGYVMGLPTTAYDMYEDYQKGDIKQMGLDAMGLIPAFKLMKYSKFAKSATQGINMAFKFNKAVDVANMANDVNQTIKKNLEVT